MQRYLIHLIQLQQEQAAPAGVELPNNLTLPVRSLPDVDALEALVTDDEDIRKAVVRS